MADKAMDRGVDREFAASLQRIHEKLANEPLTWGEIRFHLRHLGLAMCHAPTEMFYVRYGVDEARKLVLIRDILPWSRYNFLMEGP